MVNRIPTLMPFDSASGFLGSRVLGGSWVVISGAKN